MSLELNAELVMMIEDYECEERQRWAEGIDLTASDVKSDDKILLRLITEPKSKSGVVCVDDVRKMFQRMKHENYNKGVLISERFSEAAKEELRKKDIKIVSEKFMPYKPQELYLRLQDCIDGLCKAKCGQVPKRESDCWGYSEGRYPCKIRLISDDASFHFDHGWTKLLQNDLKRLLAIRNLMS
jgi:hypothetical protein